MLVKSIRYMLYTTNLPNSFCGDALATCYIQNRTFSTILVVSKTPLTSWSGKTSHLSYYMRIFDSLAYVHVVDEKW